MKIAHLIVEDAMIDDNSIVCVHPERLKISKLEKGETVSVKSEYKRQITSILLDDPNCGVNKIRMNCTIRKNLGVSIGDVVSLRVVNHIQYGKNVRLITTGSSTEYDMEDLCEFYLRPYFKDSYRPISQGEILWIHRSGYPSLGFQVLNLDSGKCCIVAPGTVVDCEREFIRGKKRKQHSFFGSFIA